MLFEAAVGFLFEVFGLLGQLTLDFGSHASQFRGHGLAGLGFGRGLGLGNGEVACRGGLFLHARDLSRTTFRGLGFQRGHLPRPLIGRGGLDVRDIAYLPQSAEIGTPLPMALPKQARSGVMP